MDLVVFDLDGTLLNKQQRLSATTIDTLEKMKHAGIAYTLATGRTHLAAQPCIEGHNFPLWQIYKNGVEWWHPEQQVYRHNGLLNHLTIRATLDDFAEQGVMPFVFCLDAQGQQQVFYPDALDKYGKMVLEELSGHDNLTQHDLSELTPETRIINISALGHPSPLQQLVERCSNYDDLVAYCGGGIYHPETHWIDIHHNSTCKGSAIIQLMEELSATNLIVFGDGDNDLTMFDMANEAYATDNAPDYIKQKATATVGHHDADGVALFLRERFNLS